jgi:hypothetical protein
MRNSCKSSSPWDKAILPRHEVDDAVIGDRSCAHRFTHFRLSNSGSASWCVSPVPSAPVITIAASNWRRSSLCMPTERRGQQTCALRRKVEPRGIRATHVLARCSRGYVRNPNSSIMVSKVQVSPRWLQNTPSMSNSVVVKRSATPMTSEAITNRKMALRSTKRRTNQGQAMRSIFGRLRVTQRVRPSRRAGEFGRSAPASGPLSSIPQTHPRGFPR